MWRESLVTWNYERRVSLNQSLFLWRQQRDFWQHPFASITSKCVFLTSLSDCKTAGGPGNCKTLGGGSQTRRFQNEVKKLVDILANTLKKHVTLFLVEWKKGFCRLILCHVRPKSLFCYDEFQPPHQFNTPVEGRFICRCPQEKCRLLVPSSVILK